MTIQIKENQWYFSNNFIEAPLVSVITPCFKGEKFIEGLINDIISQTIADKTELIIIDSASPENEADIVMRYLDKTNNIRFMRTTEQDNPSVAFNKMLAVARGSFIGMAMIDDRHRPDALELKANELLAHPDVDLVYADNMNTPVMNDAFATTKATKRRIWISDAHVHMRSHCCVGPQPMYRKALIEKYGDYDVDLPWANDWELYLKFSEAGCQFRKVEDVLGLYYVNPKGIENSHPGVAPNTKVVVERYQIRSTEYRAPGLEDYTLTDAQRFVQKRPACRVSVIMTCQNQGKLLQASLMSISQCLAADFEVIVVDDGCDDDGLRLARQLTQEAGDWVKLIEMSQQDRNKAELLNRGILAANGQYVLLMEAGDRLLPSVLDAAFSMLDDDPSVGYVYADQQYVENGAVERTVDFSVELLKQDNFVQHNVLLRANAWVNAQGFRVSALGSCWDFWLKLAALGIEGKYLKECLFVKAGLYSQSEENKQLTAKQVVVNNPEIYTEEQVAEATLLLDVFQQQKTQGDASQVSPLVSVIVATYNRRFFLVDSLRSIMAQTYQDFEIIVVNDGGEDVEDIVNKVNTRGKIVYVKNALNKGASAARNKALQVAKGEIIAYLDDDDLFRPNHLQVLVDELLKGDANFVYTGVEYVNEEIDGEQRIVKHRETPLVYMKYSKERLHINNFIPTLTWGHLRSVNDLVGHFDESLKALEDWDFLLRVSRACQIKQIDSVTVEVRQRVGESGHLSVRESKNFHDLFKVIYARYSDLDSSKISTARRQTLNNLLIRHSMDARDDKESQTQWQIANALEQSLQAQSLIGGSLVKITKTVIENHFADLNKDESLNQLYFETAKKIYDQVIIDSKQTDTLVTECGLGSLDEVSSLLWEVLRKQSTAQQSRALFEEVSRYEQNSVYQQWIENHGLLEIDGQLFAERMFLHWEKKPVFHCICFLYPGETELLANTIDSLAAQYYKDWRFTVISDHPAPDLLFEELDFLQWVQVDDSQNPYHVLNKLILDNEGDWVALIEPGASFEPHCLIRLGDYINLKTGVGFLYVDEDTLTEEGRRVDPLFKPDFNLDLLRSKHYIGGFSVINKSILMELGGFQATPDLENYDMLFKVFELGGEDSICHLADVLYHRPAQSRRLPDAKIRHVVVENHLIRSGVAADIVEGYLPETQRIIYHHVDSPLVSIIIPTKNKLEFFQPCIESLFNKTEGVNFEVIVVNNQSDDPEMLEYLSRLPDMYPQRLQVIDYDSVFNYAAISNVAARIAKGDYLLFLNNDTEVIHREWLSRMMTFAQRSDVGIVGARLVRPEHGSLQHVGVVLGLDSIADHPYNGMLDINSPGYMGRALLDQNYSAVTGACLLIRKSVYQAVDGMDEVDFPISYNDIDLCLKVISKGYRNVWTPYATLVHHASISQNAELDPLLIAQRNQKFKESRQKIFYKWRDLIADDPAYNRNLTLMFRNYAVDASLPCNWDVNFHEKLRVLGIPLPGGAGDYRIIMPFKALSQAGVAQCEYIRLGQNLSRRLSVSEIARLAPDTLVLHSAINDQELSYMEDIRKLNKDVFIVFSLDDLITQIPQKSTAYQAFMRNYRDVSSRLRKALSYCDRLVVSTQPLADLCKDMIDDIHIVPNRLNRDMWCNLKSKRKQGEKLRVGWAGAQQHQGDLEIIFDVVKQTADTVDWVFMGMCPEEIEPYVKENHGFVPIELYPSKLASLNLDIAVAPLDECQFNDAKSNLRLLEYGILGWPVICSDVYPYRSYDAPVMRVENTYEAWLGALQQCIDDMSSTYDSGNKLKAWVQDNFILEEQLQEWEKALTR